MKYKQLYLKAKNDIQDLEWKLKNEQRDKLKAKKDLEILEGQISRFEGMERDLRVENKWLKTTLRLVVVDGEKVKTLINELERDPNNHQTLRF